jgi:hypothetical protein
MRKLSLLSVVLIAACHGSGDGVDGACACNGGVNTPTAVIPVTWVDGAWVQPVPSWGSPVRLQLPVPVDSIILGPNGGLGFFGAHEGGHVEGLDHLWIPVRPGTVIGSWADGTVLDIQNIDGSFYVDIDYGQGLVGKHQVAERVLVAVGQHVKAGDPVVVAAGNAEFNLVDYNRTDGIRTGDTGGANVSPFDYLKPDAQAALIARHVNEVVNPYFAKGSSAGNSRPWEPNLTNKILNHADHRGTFLGEWLLTNKGWTVADPLYFDVITIHDVTNSYGHFQHIDLEDMNAPPTGSELSDGTWVPGDSAGKFIMSMTFNGPVYYARYAVDESGPRAKLTIEWKVGSYPASISSNAAVYIERKNVYLGLDAQELGLIPRTP